MSSKPDLRELSLPDCCRDAVRRVRETTGAAEQLRAALVSGPFFSMLTSGPLDADFTITSADWDALGRATRLVKPLLRDQCERIATLHSFDHSSGEIEMFWVALAEAFI